MSTIGDNILLKRKEMGMTQEELAKRLGYKSKSTINKIEMGINDVPQSKIMRFAEALCTTPAYLMGWKEDAKKENSPDELELTEEEMMIIKTFRQIPKEHRKVYLDMGRVYANGLKKD